MAGVWFDVPLDIIYLLAKRMTAKLSDLVTFSVVCRSWRCLLLENQWLDYARQLEALIGVSSLHLPKLMVPDETNNYLTDTRDFFDWGMGQTFRIHLPEARGRFCCGSNNGWLVTANDDMEIQLLNPITREQFLLPSLCSPDGCQLHYIRKATIFGNPCISGDCTVVAVFFGWLAVMKPGRDDAWKMVMTHYMLDNITHHRGLLHGVTYNLGHVEVWSTNPVQMMMRSSLASPIPYQFNINRYDSYFPEVNGEVIVVSRTLQDVITVLGKRALIVVKLEDDCRWVEVQDLGDCCLFLGNNTSTALSPIPPGSGFQRNCIYFSHHSHFEPFSFGKSQLLQFGLLSIIRVRVKWTSFT